MSLISLGPTDVVYQLNVLIVVKRARTRENEQIDHANEQRIFQFLENCSLIPYLVRCYYRVPNNTFLKFAPNRCVAMLLSQYQKRHSHGTQVLKISQTLDLQNVHCRIKQLCLAAADLERIELIHKNIRPENMLLNSNWNLKLSDFDREMKAGKNVAVLTEPFERLLNKKNCGGLGTYGKANAQTETFAIDSVYYIFLRGHEPYETESWGRNHFVVLSEKFQNKELSPLT